MFDMSGMSRYPGHVRSMEELGRKRESPLSAAKHTLPDDEEPDADENQQEQAGGQGARP